ncbi:MAG: AAA family ATPase, partial [Bacteroidales bacterium]|nr:AAA family ATPase [Bacteroidales bacterium]
KFSQMSIFSTLNNLHDISLLPDYERLCGISMDEFVTQLKNGLKDFADYNGYTFDETVQRFKNKYDGYHFSFLKQDVFNPFSVIKALNDKMLNNYWFGSATPSALLKLIRKFDFSMENFEMIECDSDRFNQPVEKVTDLIPFLFQSGYLTIKDYNREYDLYTLGFPNEEVRSSTAKTLFNYNYQNTDTVPLKKSYIDFSKNDDLGKFIEALKKFFRRFPFSLNNMNEKHYHSILYTVLTSFGADISANQETALGKSDLILKMPKTVYVIELKYDRSVESALDQIDDRDYTAAMLDDKKRIVKLAIKFSEKDRNIVDYKAVEVKI